MIFFRFVVFQLASIALMNSLPANADEAIDDILTKAKAEYEMNIAAANDSVVEAMSRARDAAQKRGDLDLLKTLSQELQVFREQGTLPKSLSSQRFVTKFRFARKRMEDAYETAVRAYTKAGQIELATATQREAKEFQAGRRSPPADAAIFNGRYYKVFDIGLKWHEAKKHCEQMGGTLAKIRNEEENAFVWKLAQKENVPVIWLGATDESQEGHWRWIDGTPLEFSKWHEKQPNNAQGVEHFLVLHIHNGEWNDYPAVAPEFPKLTGGRAPGFVCEWKQ